MAQPEVTVEDVLAAIHECDGLGQAAFVEKYRAFGFGPARDYFIRHAGRFYPSKIVLAAAHGHRHDQALRADEFSGGDAHAPERLRRLGFFVSEPSPNWSEDEITLACQVVARHGWRGLSDTHPEVIELSRLLQECSSHPHELRGPRFRNANGVGRKTADIATQHPGYQGQATNGNRLDRVVLQAFLDQPEQMNARADAIAAAMRAGVGGGLVLDVDLDASADEGGVLEHWHLVRERNPKLRRDKIDAVLAAGGALACEVCAFDFESAYGPRGRGYIEVHHRIPLHASGRTVTRLGDLVLLCSNCHRMIHREAPWLTVEELRDVLRAG